MTSLEVEEVALTPLLDVLELATTEDLSQAVRAALRRLDTDVVMREAQDRTPWRVLLGGVL